MKKGSDRGSAWMDFVDPLIHEPRFEKTVYEKTNYVHEDEKNYEKMTSWKSRS